MYTWDHLEHRRGVSAWNIGVSAARLLKVYVGSHIRWGSRTCGVAYNWFGSPRPYAASALGLVH